jgi:hypothetical protein
MLHNIIFYLFCCFYPVSWAVWCSHVGPLRGTRAGPGSCGKESPASVCASWAMWRWADAGRARWAGPSREESQVERASFPGRQSARDSTPSWTYIVAPDIHTSSRRKADLQAVASLETGDGEEAGCAGHSRVVCRCRDAYRCLPALGGGNILASLSLALAAIVSPH